MTVIPSMETVVIRHARSKQIPIVLLMGLFVMSVGIAFDVHLKHVTIITELMVSGVLLTVNQFWLNGYALEELRILLINAPRSMETELLLETNNVMTEIL